MKAVARRRLAAPDGPAMSTRLPAGAIFTSVPLARVAQERQARRIKALNKCKDRGGPPPPTIRQIVLEA